jgi:hypothetical protein
MLVAMMMLLAAPNPHSLDAPRKAYAPCVKQFETKSLAAQQMREEERQRVAAEREAARAAREAAKPTMADKMLQSAGRAVASSVGRQLGNSLLRGIFGGLVRGR